MKLAWVYRCFVVATCLFATTRVVADEQVLSLENSQKEQEGPLPGHSLHGAVFNHGPRQAAYLMEGMGEIDFPVTTESPEAQKFINQGVAQLHGFWFFEAERSFRQAAVFDPECAMAYWGMSMANLMNEPRMEKFAKEAEKHLTDVTEREVLYIRSLRKLPTWQLLIDRFPDEIEAKAFLGIYPYIQTQRDRKKMRGLEPADALLQQVLDIKPMHPCHHYRIHLWDTRDPARALESAALCPRSAPGIAHMWHMSGHLYSMLHRYQEAVWFMDACLRVDHHYARHDQVHPDIMHVYTHNAEWLVRSLAHVGRAHDAIDRAKDLIELPRHPEFNMLQPETSSFYGRQRLLEVLAQYELWEQLIELAGTHYLEPTKNFSDRVRRDLYLGIAHSRRGDLPAAQEQLTTLVQLRDRQRELDVNQKSDRLEQLEDAVSQMAGHLAVAEQKTVYDELSLEMTIGLSLLAVILFILLWMFERRMVQIAYGILLSVAVGFLLFWLTGPSGQTATVTQMYRARDLLAAGRTSRAVQAARDLVAEHTNEVQPLADLVYVLGESGDQAAARKTLDQLREYSGEIELDLPAFTRLQPLAKEFGYPEDWRIKEPLPEEHDDLPPLDSLGPLRWRPTPAPDWSLPDSTGKTISLKDYRGKPVIVVFYLGYGCLHCAEQMQAFAKKSADFRKAGLTIVAVSTDKQELLMKSHENYQGGKFPFDLVADPELNIFKKYRCFDDFEHLTLHGTFLVDPAGLIRWQDISYEPFLDADFLIAEAKRLLAIPVREDDPGDDQK